MMQPFRTCSNRTKGPSAESIECLREDSQYSNKPPEVHGSTRCSTCDPGSSLNVTKHKNSSINFELEQQEGQVRVVRSTLAPEKSSMATCMEQLVWMRTQWGQMTTVEFPLRGYTVALKKQPTSLVTVCKESVRCDAPGRSRSFINGQAHELRKAKQTGGGSTDGTRPQTASPSTHRESLKRYCRK